MNSNSRRRGNYQEIAARGGGIKSTVRKTRRRVNKKELVKAGRHYAELVLAMRNDDCRSKIGIRTTHLR